jgi:hypothetical protein
MTHKSFDEPRIVRHYWQPDNGQLLLPEATSDETNDATTKQKKSRNG